MAVVLDGIIKQEDLDVLPQRVSFQDLVGEENRRSGDAFVRFLPGGRLPARPDEQKAPDISSEELQQRRLETIERETYQKAFAAGEEAGLALGEQTMEREMARLLPQFESVLRQLDGLPKRVFASAERFLVETAILMTRELLAHELTVDPEEIAHRVRRVLDQAAGRRDIIIYLAPDSAALLQNLGSFDKLRIEADPHAAPGSVRMESDFGGIEDNLERQLADMEAGLRAYLQDRLQASGCDDLAASAAQFARQDAINHRALSLPVRPSAVSSPPVHSMIPPLEPEQPRAAAGRSAPLGAIAAALAEDQDHDAAWPPEQAGGPEEEVDEEEDSAFMEATVVSTATSRMAAVQWGQGRDEDFYARSGDPAADAQGLDEEADFQGLDEEVSGAADPDAMASAESMPVMDTDDEPPAAAWPGTEPLPHDDEIA
ncbi:MAG: FliH/SctL family protein [Magnetococcus sp. DMHC-8]